MNDPILISQDGAVRVISLNNPAARNALSAECMDALIAALNEADADAGVGAIVLTGEGPAFCSGGDLNRLAERRAMTLEDRRAKLERLNETIRAVRRCSKPIIAAVEGPAAGAGLSLALACDLIVAARNATFSVAYVKVGLSPDGGATAFLAEFVSRQILTELCLTGERVSGERMNEFGLINRLTEAGGARAVAVELAASIGTGPQRAMARIKTLCNVAGHNTLDDQMDLEAALMADSQGDDEAAEGIAAFLAKRPADFVGLRGTE